MKVSEITVNDIANYMRLSEISEEDKKNIELFLKIAKNYVENYTAYQKNPKISKRKR